MYCTNVQKLMRQWISSRGAIRAICFYPYHNEIHLARRRTWKSRTLALLCSCHLTKTTVGFGLVYRMSFTLVSLYLFWYSYLLTASTTVLLSLLVTFEGVYQKKYLNILEHHSLWFTVEDRITIIKRELVAIISVSAALATFIGILLFHASCKTQQMFQEIC